MDPAMISAVVAGASLASTSIQQISGAMQTNRNATVEITNHCKNSLIEPKWYCHSGYVYSPLPTVIKPRTREAASFSKVGDTACGSVFVFSYKLNYSKKFAILVSVPYDYNIFENWFGALIMDVNEPTDADLYNKIYYRNECAQNRLPSKDGSLKVQDEEYIVSITMSDSAKAVVKIDVYENFGTNDGPDTGEENWQWISCSNGNYPATAFVGGYEEDGDGARQLLVVRATVNGALTPGKLLADAGVGTCNIPWGGCEHLVTEYEVLAAKPGSFRWIRSSHGHKHQKAVVAGKAENGDDLLVGRVSHRGGQHPGKIHPATGKCYIAYGGVEIEFDDYEILIH